MDEIQRKIIEDEWYRKERETKMVQEGLQLCQQRKEDQIRMKKIEQYENKIMLDKYNPWGRPGGGAPNEMDVRRRKTNIHYFDWKHQRFGRQKPKQLIRSQKQRPPFKRRADPFLRFQFLPPVRKSVDLNYRYHRTPAEKMAYKLELDNLVACKRRIEHDMMRKSTSLEQKLLAAEAPWGKPGPGGSTWRDPRTIGYNFLHSMGWTGEPAFRRLEQEQYAREQQYKVPRSTDEYPALHGPHTSNKKEIHPPEELLTGGIELVPLLARRRTLPRRSTLRTTDVTNQKLQEQQQYPQPLQPARNSLWNETSHDKEYLAELTNQVRHKQMKIKEDHNEDLVKSQKHFETWGKFWGRPGHGAPRGRNVKENLEFLLYQVPVK